MWSSKSLDSEVGTGGFYTWAGIDDSRMGKTLKIMPSYERAQVTHDYHSLRTMIVDQLSTSTKTNLLEDIGTKASDGAHVILIETGRID
jgi:hypothetical protein